MATSEAKKIFVPGVIFGLCILALCMIPSPLQLFVLPYHLLAARTPGASHTAAYWHNIFSADVAAKLDIAHWTIVTAIFAWFARNVRWRFIIPLAVATIAAVFFAMLLILRLFGMGFYWDIWH